MRRMKITEVAPGQVWRDSRNAHRPFVVWAVVHPDRIERLDEPPAGWPRGERLIQQALDDAGGNVWPGDVVAYRPATDRLRRIRLDRLRFRLGYTPVEVEQWNREPDANLKRKPDDCPMCGAPPGKRCLTKSGKRRGRPHTARTATQENTMPNEAIITDEMRAPDERVKVHPFRHPWIKGTDTDPECGRTWHDHGWIDRGDHGFTVCPTEAVRPDAVGEPETTPQETREGCPDVEFEPIRTLADDEVAVKRDAVKAAETLAVQKRDWVLRGRLLDALGVDR